MELQDTQLKIYDKQLKKLQQIADYANRSIDAVIDDMITTFCFMPAVVTSDMEDFCIKQITESEKLSVSNQSGLTKEKIYYYNRVKYFLDQVYMAQKEYIKSIEEK